MAERQKTPIQRRIATWIPYLWLLIFFLAPFVIVLKISLSTTAIAMPPYTPVFDSLSDMAGRLRQFTFDNYVWLTEDALYVRAYLSSVVIAGVSALLTLLIGFPLAYGMARAPRSIRPLLVMLVILPFWTSFLIRVYAWIGILKPEGLLNQFLIWLGVIADPLIIINTNWAVFIGIVYSYLPFMVLPLYASLEKLDESLLEAAADLGSPPDPHLLADHRAAGASRRRRRRHAGVHPGGRRVRHPRPARRLGNADDRPHAVERVLLQPRLAAGERRRHRAPHPAGGADRLLPEHPGEAARGGEMRRFSLFNVVSLVVGFTFLYLPIVLLVDLFLQRVAAGYRLGRLLHQVVRLAPAQPGHARRRLGDDPRGAAVGDCRYGARHDGGGDAGQARALLRAATSSPAWSMRRSSCPT